MKMNEPKAAAWPISLNAHDIGYITGCYWWMEKKCPNLWATLSLFIRPSNSITARSFAGLCYPVIIDILLIGRRIFSLKRRHQYTISIKPFTKQEWKILLLRERIRSTSIKMSWPLCKMISTFLWP